MNYWLVKSEPFKYSWNQLRQDKRTMWDGVRNYTARNNLRAMKNGDLVFFYHSNDGLEIVGIARVIKEYYPDPTVDGDTWSVVDLEPLKELKKSVTLSTIKQNEKLSQMQLVKQSRLSVSSVTKKEFDEILRLSGTVI
ncbi:MAG TPA: EVE domain-containing protein [Chitinophagaceae bacterium]|nr:MAG: ubiquinol-cytochrome C reductase [Bacteroidetes bacterium OLB11]HMN32208.1 EVE domain-containing protein [Chitinophagaceae bacterium]